MKVCLVAPVSRWRGGIHQYSVNLANNLATKADVEVVGYKSIFPLWLYPGESKKISGEFAVAEGIQVHEILKYYSLLSSFKAARIINSQIRPDVVEIQWVAPQHGFVLIPLMLFLKFWFRSKAKIFLNVHNVLPHESRLFDRIFSRLAFGRADKLLVHAERLSAQMVENFGQSIDKISIIPHGVCVDGAVRYERRQARAELGIKEEYVLLFFGFVRPYKGLDDLIKAFGEVAKKFDVALVVAGEFFTDLKHYERELEKSDLLNRTYIFPRYIAYEEVSLFFNAADMLVQPYVRFAGQSGIPQTAYLHSLPVVATDVGGLPEMVIHGETGLIVPPGDPQALASAIEVLLSDREKRRRYGLSGKRLLESDFAWDRVTEKRLKVYAEA
ncbi:MAG: glycosyltransferase family 4 protein [Candidatus Binatia bacterium]